MASLVLLALSWVLRPDRAVCPVGYDTRTGIRRDGAFECWPAPRPSPGRTRDDYLDYDGTFGRPERSVQPGGVLEGRIWCSGGKRPVAGEDGRSVRCQR